ncbi:MAG: ribosome silencing factor [Calditrichaeota bacterium]|nr:MAG: ribosome silencing factor [Calditrichota bacterium]MBL1204714.1 ribosome silencing factor [Calditrichota bacterium]NOG44542.1 ribosome silencing factor [Calditrichota bacterium]
MTSNQLAEAISNYALEKKGHQIAILNVRELSSVTDYFVIVSAESQAQLKAIADNIERKIRKDEKVHLYHKEGINSPNWILLDYVDVVVHIFRKETREHFGLERLWADAEMKLVMEEEA